MPRFCHLLLILIALHGQHLWAQSRQDSITHRYDSLAKIKLQDVDTSGQQLNKKIDVAQQKVNNLFNPNLNQLAGKARPQINKAKHDSIRFHKKLDREKKRVLRKKVEAEKQGENVAMYDQQLDSLNQVTYQRDSSNNLSKTKQTVLTNKQKLTDSADSVTNINLSTEKYSAKIDSVAKKPLSKVNEVELKVTGAEQKLNEPVTQVESKINEKLNLMNQEGGAGANLPGTVNAPDASLNIDHGLTDQIKLPATDLKTNNPLSEIDNPLKEQMSGAGEVKDKLTEVKSLPQEQLGKVKSIDEVKSVQEKIGTTSQLTDKAQAYSDDVKSIAKGDLNEVKELPKAAEQQAMKLDEVQGLQKEAGQFDQYKEMADKAKDPSALKDEAMKQAPALAMNHFAGKEQVLQDAMDKLDKLKQKYAHLSTIKENMPRKMRNAMYGKSFIERLVPGITLQIQKSGNVLLDYSPVIGYRFTGRFTAGAGWNERVTIGKHVQLSLDDRIYGPRLFADFKIKKGFSVRTDIEKMNTYVLAPIAGGYSASEGYRAWVWSAFVGLKKEYQLVKTVKGNVQFLYNLYDDHDNSPYADRINIRFGFDFPMKIKAKKTQIVKNAAQKGGD